MTEPIIIQSAPIFLYSAENGLFEDGIASAPEADEELDGIAPAKNSREGEYIRLKEDMIKLAQRNIWDGVEKNYQEILKLHGVKIEARVYFLASQAGQGRGDILAFYQRSKLTLEAGPNSQTRIDANKNRADVEASYGFVEIRLPGPASHLLNLFSFPFPPDQRQSIEFARGELSKKGIFEGLLPAGIEFSLIPATDFPHQTTRNFTLDSIQGHEGEPPLKIEFIVRQEKHPSSLGTVSLGTMSLPPKKISLHGEFGMQTGYRTTAPVYGPSYLMDGVDSSAFVGSHLRIPLTPSLLLLTGARIVYGSTIQNEPETDGGFQNEFANSYLQGSLRAAGLYRLKEWNVGGGVHVSYGTNFTEQEPTTSIIGDNKVDPRVQVGSGNVELERFTLVQAPVWGATLLFEKELLPNKPCCFLELGFEHSVIGIEGEVHDNPQWKSGAPFSTNLYKFGLGVTI